MRPLLLATGAVLAFVSAACSSVQALGPTPAGEGIVIYIQADFAGPSHAINVDVADLGKVQGPCSGGAEGEVPTWKDCVSSVKVLPGWSATLYRDVWQKGHDTAAGLPVIAVTERRVLEAADVAEDRPVDAAGVGDAREVLGRQVFAR